MGATGGEAVDPLEGRLQVDCPPIDHFPREILDNDPGDFQFLFTKVGQIENSRWRILLGTLSDFIAVRFARGRCGFRGNRLGCGFS